MIILAGCMPIVSGALQCLPVPFTLEVMYAKGYYGGGEGGMHPVTAIKFAPPMSDVVVIC